jgi:hypothetical protein
MSIQEQEFEQLKTALLEEERLDDFHVGCHPYLFNEHVSLQFCGWEIVLLPDGKYFINDTTGG